MSVAICFIPTAFFTNPIIYLSLDDKIFCKIRKFYVVFQSVVVRTVQVVSLNPIHVTFVPLFVSTIFHQTYSLNVAISFFSLILHSPILSQVGYIGYRPHVNNSTTPPFLPPDRMVFLPARILSGLKGLVNSTEIS